MPSTRRTRTIAAPAEDLWRIVSDPYHLPRWWPRVTRMEDVREDAFTQVMQTERGKVVRADFRVRRRDEAARTLVWEQLVEGTPFERVLSGAETEVSLVAAAGVGAATEVTIELRQTLSGGANPSGMGMRSRLIPRLGSMMVSRAARATLEQALDGLERIGA